MSKMRFLAALASPFVAGGLLHLVYPLVQSAGYHQFADTRLIGGVPNGANVLSSLAILAAGLVNLLWCWRHRGSNALQMPGMLTASLGLIITVAGSAAYHFSPTDSTLVWDRLPMTIVFAGILGMLYTSVTGRRLLWWQVPSMVTAAMLTVLVWVWSGALWPYTLLQYGGLAAIVGFTCWRKVANPGGWWGVICWYGVAKIFETLDASVWFATHHIVAGHTLKHIACGAAGFALLSIAKERTSNELMPHREDPLPYKV
ncbi:hypothetical protein AWB78_02478 [Caballeronia calidae]|uniref:Ceramidase n=1 Tax=Caballeronia calidae TaxID=1777139 RepID=A0A158BB91_9BURK|nr:hypothetical protein [Caballeronia calidae]SAK67345.1 hypothetical protein AWB78_02478 [Caballeronia calidae]